MFGFFLTDMGMLSMMRFGVTFTSLVHNVNNVQEDLPGDNLRCSSFNHVKLVNFLTKDLPGTRMVQSFL